jgi:hypothetical protein
MPSHSDGSRGTAVLERPKKCCRAKLSLSDEFFLVTTELYLKGSVIRKAHLEVSLLTVWSKTNVVSIYLKAVIVVKFFLIRCMMY